MKAEYSIGKAFLFKSLCKNPEVAAKYDEYIKAFYKVACVNGKEFSLAPVSDLHRHRH